MKILGKIIVALSIITMASCSTNDATKVGFAALAGDTQKISASKKIETRSLTLKDFSSINIVGAFKVNIRQGGTYAVEVTMPENYFNYLKSKSKDGKLEISMNNKYQYNWSSRQLKEYVINITMPKLKSIETSGSVDTKVIDNFYFESLELNISGQSSVEFEQNISLKKLVAECTGQSSIEFEDVVANSILANSIGQSSIKADNISAEKASIGSNGQSAVNIDEAKSKKMECICSGQSAIKFKSLTATEANLEASGMSSIKAKKSDIAKVSKDTSGMSSIDL